MILLFHLCLLLLLVHTLEHNINGSGFGGGFFGIVAGVGGKDVTGLSACLLLLHLLLLFSMVLEQSLNKGGIVAVSLR